MAGISFTGVNPDVAAQQVVAAIRGSDWPALSALLSANPGSVGELGPWQRPQGPPSIIDRPEVHEIPDFMRRYPGKLLVRYDLANEPRVYKLEVVVEQIAGGFRAIDFWGVGW
jgi:hypothetical protein